MRVYIYLLVTFIVVTSCKKDDIMFFEGPDAISIYLSPYQADSLVYSFAYSFPEVIRDTVYLQIRIQGAARPIDRQVEMMAINGSTAVEGVDYILPKFKFPAGAIKDLYPIVLLRSPQLKTETRSLYISVKPNNDFEKGALGQEIGGSYIVDHYQIIFNDFLSEPSYWPYIESEVGSFSVTKLQFMLRVYGAGTHFGSLSTGERLNLRLRLRTALAEYEAENGPLLDENNIRVTF